VSATSAFESAVSGGKGFSEVLNGLATDLEKIILRMTVTNQIAAALDSLMGKAGTGGQAGTGLTGWIQGGGLSRAISSIGSWFGSDSGWTPEATFIDPSTGREMPMLAHGGVVAGGNVVPFARGGLVDRPTIFPMARGYGLMGEAGPEAVMPLKRLPSGNLGVEGAAGGVTVNVINNAGAQVTTEQKRDQRGGLTIDVMIDAVEQAMAQRLQRPGTTLNRALGVAANPIKAR
jgi:phage-related minor tail protein